jgi:hypothetical protein
MLKQCGRTRKFFGDVFANAWLLIAIFIFVAGFAIRSPAQNQDGTGMFPDPGKVTADYPDEVQRYAAFSTLYDALMADAPKPMSKANYEKSFTYTAVYNGIENEHLMAGRQSPVYQTWAAQRDKMIDDFTLRRSVLEKYHLAALTPIARPPPPSAVNTAPGYQPSSGQAAQTTFVLPNVNQQIYDQSSPGERLNRLCVRAFPVVAVSLVAMIWLPWLMLGRSGIKSRFTKPPTLEPDGNLPPLPESLRVIQLPGVRYYVKTFSGLVLGKETAIYTSSYTDVRTRGNHRWHREAHARPDHDHAHEPPRGHAARPHARRARGDVDFDRQQRG